MLYIYFVLICPVQYIVWDRI